MASPTTVLIASAGSSPIAMFQQTQGGITVLVQQASLVDPTSGNPSTIDADGNLFVKLQTGAQNSGSATASAIASGASVTLTPTANVTSGMTGTLQHAIFAATQPTLWQLQTVNNAGAATNVGAPFLTGANESFDFKPGSVDEVPSVLSTGSSCKFQVTAQNLSANTGTGGNANAYVTFWWAEN